MQNPDTSNQTPKYKHQSENADLMRALMDADNAIQKAISFFKRTAKENQR